MSTSKKDLKHSKNPYKNSSEKKIMNKQIICFILLAVLCFAAMLIFAYNNSPLVERYGEDGAMYLVMGRSIANGGIMYKDLFDHKGPIIFLLNAIPQIFIEGTLGVWILEVLFLIATVFIIYKTGLLLLENNSALAPCIVYIFLMVFLSNGGNYSEEYGNLFVWISIYIFVKWIKNDKSIINPFESVLLGISLAFVFFMKPNVIAVIWAVILSIIIYTIKGLKKKALIPILKYLGFGLGGILIITIPLIIFHCTQGTLYDMFYATILHNFSYVKAGWVSGSADGFHISLFYITILIINLVIIYSIYKLYKNKQFEYGTLLVVSAILTIVSVLAGKKEFYYYLMSELPVLVIALVYIYKYIHKTVKNYYDRHEYRLALEILVVFIIWSGFKIPGIIDLRQRTDVYRDKCISLSENITYDRDKVFGFDVEAPWFYITDIEPSFKYFTMQTWMSCTNSDINNQVVNYINKDHPTWIVTYYEDAKNDLRVNEILREEYTLVESNDTGYLYKYNGK